MCIFFCPPSFLSIATQRNSQTSLNRLCCLIPVREINMNEHTGSSKPSIRHKIVIKIHLWPLWTNCVNWITASRQFYFKLGEKDRAKQKKNDPQTTFGICESVKFESDGLTNIKNTSLWASLMLNIFCLQRPNGSRYLNTSSVN